MPSGWSARFLLRGQQRSASGTHAPQFAPGELKERKKKAPTKHAEQTKPKWKKARGSINPGPWRRLRPCPRHRPRRDAHGPARDARAATVPAPGRGPRGRAPAALARRRGFLGVSRRRRGSAVSMGLRDWLRTLCCCCPCMCLEESAVLEKEPLVRWVRVLAGIWGYLAATRRRGVGIPACLSELAYLKIPLRHKLSPLVPYRISCCLGKIFVRKHRSSEGPETQVMPVESAKNSGAVAGRGSGERSSHRAPTKYNCD